MREKKVYPLIGDVTTAHRYAIIGNADRFSKRKHAWKAYKTLRNFGCNVSLVADDLKRFEGTKVYPDLIHLKDKIDVVVPCLRAELIPNIIEEAKECGAIAIWFQEKNWTEEFQAQAEKADIIVLRGCILKHKEFRKPLCFLNPCYWHGRTCNKGPRKK